MSKFDKMGKKELRAACKEAGIKNYGLMTNDIMRSNLEAHYAKQNKPKVKKQCEQRNGVRRPSLGGICRAVWDKMDEIVANNIAPSIKLVKAIAAECGWNLNNATIEFYQWRKFNK